MRVVFTGMIRRVRHGASLPVRVFGGRVVVVVEGGCSRVCMGESVRDGDPRNGYACEERKKRGQQTRHARREHRGNVPDGIGVG